ncbi:MAG TPA: hypothetical protein VIH85_05560 [Solirubrobacteraceae bacterium]
MSSRPRRALLGLLSAVAAFAVLPGTALADFTPALSLDQTAGTTAGSSPATGFNATFNSTSGDSVKDVTFALPPGLLANANINGGACLIATTASSACQIGTGSLNAGAIPVTEYLVAAPSGSGAAGGVEVVNNGTGTALTTAAVSLTATGLDVAFTNLSAGISEMNFTLTDLRLPTSCPTPPANVTITADSQQAPSTSTTATAPLNVTGCASLTYAPALSATITKDAHDSGAGLVLGITQGATDSANKTIVLALPKGLTPNVGADASCLNATGCQIGTATATSPLVPSVALANGKVNLTASGTTPTISIAFPPPFAITLNGAVDLNNNTVTFSNVPDVPLTALNLNVGGPNGQKAFNTDCAPASVGGAFTAQSGATKNVSPAITFVDCAVKPTATGSTSGLSTGHPKVKLKVVHGTGAANVASVAIGLPSGLTFSRSAVVSHKTCTTLKNKKKKCTTTTLIKGLGISGGKAKSVALKGGKLVVTLSKAAGSVTFSLSGPLVNESKALQTKVKKHKAGKLTFTLKVTDAKKVASTVAVKLAAH